MGELQTWCCIQRLRHAVHEVTCHHHHHRVYSLILFYFLFICLNTVKKVQDNRKTVDQEYLV